MALKESNGFTLLEIVIAMFILIVALLGLITVTITVMRGNSFSKEMTTATTLAKDKLEEKKNQSYASITAGTSIDYLNIDSSSGAAGAFYTRTLTVAPLGTEMKTITVEVSWSWEGVTRRVTLSTIMADTG